ncbi:Uncharacterised protein [Chlamydia trachomatis]|nr:Uncharacterised protein [Chlamydia trachomatis]
MLSIFAGFMLSAYSFALSSEALAAFFEARASEADLADSLLLVLAAISEFFAFVSDVFAAF